MTTRSDMLEAGRQAVWRKVQYVYGAKPSKGAFRIYSRSEIQALRNVYGDMVWVSDLNKAGHECCDCSGLMTYATGEVVGSYYLRDDAVRRYSISQLWDDWDKYVGMVLWLPGHVGIVSDEHGKYYAMDGSARNAVHNPMSMNNWQEVLEIRGVDYSQEAAEVITEKDLKAIADYVWARDLNGVRAIDRLMGVDLYMPERTADAVWKKKLKANGGSAKQEYPASSYQSMVDHRVDVMEDKVAAMDKKLDKILAALK